MSNAQDFEGAVITNQSKYETSIKNFLISPKNMEEKMQFHAKAGADDINNFVAFRQPPCDIVNPKISVWEYSSKEDLEAFLKLERKHQIRKHIETNLKSVPKGVGRNIFVELMYNVRKFCIHSNFDIEKTAAVLSQFYLTHIFVTGHFDRSPEKVYFYFKELMMRHSLPFLPDNIQIFSPAEAKLVLKYFYKLYLRNLPLIRFLSLPNFALYLDYDLEPEINIVVKEKRDKKNKKEKGGKKKRK